MSVRENKNLSIAKSFKYKYLVGGGWVGGLVVGSWLVGCQYARGKWI